MFKVISNPTYASIECDKLMSVLMMERSHSLSAMEDEEPGYKDGMIQAVTYFESVKHEPFNIDWFIKMHDKMSSIKTSVYPNGIPKGLRNDPKSGEGFGLVRGETFSKEGFKELIEKYKVTLDEDNDFFYKALMLNPEEYASFEEPESNVLFDKIACSLDKNLDIREIRNRFAEGSFEKKFGKIDPFKYFKYISKKRTFEYPKLLQRPIRQETAIWAFDFLFNQYKVAIAKACSDDDKLSVIVSFCQSLDQVHLFKDGNIRTIGMFTLNKLLYDNNLPFCSLNDVNVFDCLSIQELVDAVEEGQSYFKQLIY